MISIASYSNYHKIHSLISHRPDPIEYVPDWQRTHETAEVSPVQHRSIGDQDEFVLPRAMKA
jgi:hypothetical protein